MYFSVYFVCRSYADVCNILFQCCMYAKNNNNSNNISIRNKSP